MTEHFTSVVIVDLVGYSAVCKVLEDALGPEAVDKLQRRIQAVIENALRTLRRSRAKAVLKTTGDGAILEFSSANDAHRFAQALHWRREQNANRLEAPLAGSSRWRTRLVPAKVSTKKIDWSAKSAAMGFTLCLLELSTTSSASRLPSAANWLIVSRKVPLER